MLLWGETFTMFLKYRKIILVFICVFLAICMFYAYNCWNTQPLVSVVMPNYNRAHFLPRVIDSILSQTMTDFEFIIVDDGSTDDSLKILEEYQKKDSRIKVIKHEKNQGVAGARETGNQAARGKYIAIMDTDDYAYPPFLQTAVDYLEKNQDVTLVKLKGHYHSEGHDPEKDKFLFAYPVYQILFASRLANVGCVFRRDFMVKNQVSYNLNYRCAEDFDFWVKMVMKGATVRLVGSDVPLYNIRLHYTTPYTDCWKNTWEIRKNFFDFLELTEEERQSDCKIYKKAISFNPNMFDAQTTREGYREYCPPEAIHVRLVHSQWQDYIIFPNDMTRFQRFNSEDETGSLVSFIPQKEISVKWDKWGIERFLFTKDNTYKQFSEVNIKQRDWSGTLLLDKNGERVVGKEDASKSGSIVSFIPEKEIVIKWDNGESEHFFFERNDTYYFCQILQLKHKEWSDNLVFTSDMKRAHRENIPQDKAEVIVFEPKKVLTVKWNRWGTETFKYTKDGFYQFENK